MGIQAIQCNSVIAVRHGEFVQRRRDAFLDVSNLSDPDGSIVLAYYFWVIRTPSKDIVVDTGFDERVARRRGRHVIIPVTSALESLGFDPHDEVDVVVTHAHYDHIGNLGWFKRARVIIAADEFMYWMRPHPHRPDPEQISLVQQRELNVLKHARADGRLRLVHGDEVIAPGVIVLTGAGHTPGQLMVHVDTADGGVLLTSDAVHFDEELATDLTFRHMHDVAESRRTYGRIRAMQADGLVRHVLSGHDDSVSSIYPPIDGALSDHAVLIGGAPADPEHRKEER